MVKLQLRILTEKTAFQQNKSRNKKFKPKSIKAIALCTDDDETLRKLFEKYKNCEVVVYKKDIVIKK